MKHKVNMKEKISALADGELSDFETRRLLEEISSDPEYKEFWKNIQLTKLALTEEDLNLLDRDLSHEIASKLQNTKPHYKEKATRPLLSGASYIAASCVGFFAVMVYSLTPQADSTFSEKASKIIVEAIDSPQALEVLNSSVSGLNVTLQDFQSNPQGTMANYMMSDSQETFRVSLYPIEEINKIKINEATKISYLKSNDGIYVVSVSGNLSTDKKNQILRQANFFADKLK